MKHPLTEAEIEAGWKDECPLASLDTFIDGVVFAERHHGIASKSFDDHRTDFHDSMNIKAKDDLIYQAWRDSEAYAIPMTKEGARLAERRWHTFKLGWEYAQFYAKKGNIYKKDYDEQLHKNKTT